MFGTTYVKVNVLPIMVSLFRNQRLVVMRIHVTQVISRRTGKSRHGIQFEREYCYVINLGIFYHFAFFYIPGPFGSVSQWRFAGFCRQELGYFRELQRQLAFVNHVRHAVLVVNRERFAPVTLAGEDGITQTVVHFHTSQVVFLHVFLGSSNGFLDGQSVQVQVAIRSDTCFR